MHVAGPLSQTSKAKRKKLGVDGITYVLWRCTEGVRKQGVHPSVSSHTVSKINQRSDVGVAERMHDPVHTLTPLCDGLTAHLVVSDVPGSTAICGRCTWHAKHQLVSGSLLIIYTRGLSDPET